jgi:antitoxin component HigA of HigAB toxin-antitoxin module
MSLSDKLKAKAVPHTGWEDDSKYIEDNNDWLELSFKIALKVLRYLRENGMTQKALATELGFSPQYMSKVLKGRENLTLETISKIQNAINEAK